MTRLLNYLRDLDWFLVAALVSIVAALVLLLLTTPLAAGVAAILAVAFSVLSLR